jgi:hypothetical protein
MSKVSLVSEEEAADRARLMIHSLRPIQADEPAAEPSKPSPRLEMVEMMGVLARILGFRIQLAMAFGGALGLGAYAVDQANAMSLVAFGLYNLMVFAPVAYIAYRRG